jgi:hypothetical protein
MAIGRINATLSGVQPGGLAKIVPTSVAVGSGSGSSDANGTVTFDSASSVSLNGCFSSTYRNYKIIIDLTASSATSDIVMRMRAGGVNTAGTSYRYQRLRNVSTTVTGQAETSGVGTDEWFLGENVTGAEAGSAFFDITMITPNVAKYTNFYSMSSNYSTASIGMYTAGVLRDSTQYDGFSFYAISGTITGLVSVYGYN